MDDLLDDPAITTMGMLVEAHARLTGALGAELQQATTLPLAWFEVLLRLGRSPERRLRMSELARQMPLSTSGLTRLIDRVEAAGLVRREACPSDRRGQLAVLTDAGEAALAEALPVHVRGLRVHLAAALGDDVEVVTEALRRVRDALGPCPVEQPTPCDEAVPPIPEE